MQKVNRSNYDDTVVMYMYFKHFSQGTIHQDTICHYRIVHHNESTVYNLTRTSFWQHFDKDQITIITETRGLYIETEAENYRAAPATNFEWNFYPGH